MRTTSSRRTSRQPRHAGLRGAGVAAIAALMMLAMTVVTTPAAGQDAWSFSSPKLVTAGVKDPVDIAFGHDGYLYFASLTPKEVRRVHLASGELDEVFVVEFPNATWEQRTETGVFGLALDPDFAANGVMYVAYSSNTTGEWTNVLARVTLVDATGAATEEVLLTRPGGTFHNGGRILVANGHLWWTTGDASNPFTAPPKVAGQVAQEDGNRRGKVLRLTMDGDPAPGNPWNDAAYTKGHRNVYGIAWDPQGERLLVTENGNAHGDEVNVLEAGGNYGWPECEGTCAQPDDRYVDPIWETEGTVAPTGMAWFRDAFWFGTFNQGDVMRIEDTSGSWQVEKVHHYPGTDKLPPRVLDVEVGPDGQSLWFSAWSEIWRVGFEAHPDHPAVPAIAAGPFWWNGTATGERVEPTGKATDAFAPGLGWAALVAAAAGIVLRRPNARR